MDYEKLLDKGMMGIPKKQDSGKRWEIPGAVVEKAGRRTIIVNVFEIASGLRRNPSHLIKILLKELATKGEISGQRLFVLGAFTAEMINKKIGVYVKQYVLCGECGKPDTKLFKEGQYTIMKCEACGARQTIR